jgi:3-oxoacyl-[acyl-carrier-protein] synthase II
MKRVVITGTGALTPIGNNMEAFLEGLRNGVSGANLIQSFDASAFKTQFACELKDFEETDFLDRREVRRMDKFAIYGLVATDEAMKQAGLDKEGGFDPDRAGVIWGSGIGGLQTLEHEVAEHVRRDEIPRYNPFLIPKMIVDIVAGQISIKYNLRGVNYATVSACASSTHAMINAFDMVRLGRNDIVVTGGSEATVSPTGVGGFKRHEGTFYPE